MERNRIIRVNKSSLMRTVYALTFLFLMAGCNSHYTNNGERNLPGGDINSEDSINGKPIGYYIGNRRCSEIAKNYYYGKFHPSDNDSTSDLLNLSLTNDSLLRPFYFWCLNKVIKEADGALMELTGIPARNYVEKFPNEFLKHMETAQYKEYRHNWITAISYSGYYDNESAENKKIVEEKFFSKMKTNCVNCSDETVIELSKFAKECYYD